MAWVSDSRYPDERLRKAEKPRLVEFFAIICMFYPSSQAALSRRTNACFLPKSLSTTTQHNPRRKVDNRQMIYRQQVLVYRI